MTDFYCFQSNLVFVVVLGKKFNKKYYICDLLKLQKMFNFLEIKKLLSTKDKIYLNRKNFKNGKLKPEKLS